MTNQEKSRLDRIEEKIDKMSEAIIAIARVEEKISNLDESNQLLQKSVFKQEERLRRLEQGMSTLEGVYKFFWIIVTSLSSALAYVWFTK